MFGFAGILANPWATGGLVVGVIAGVAGLYGYGYHQGDIAGKVAVQAQWDKEKDAQRRAIEQARSEAQAAGTALANQFEARNRALEAQDATRTQQLQAALRRRVVCPKSGEIGDLVLPSELTRSMFIYRDAASAVPARPTPAKPNAVVR